VRINLHPVAGCGLILLFTFLGAHSQELANPATRSDPRVAAFRKSYQEEQGRDYAAAIDALRGLGAGAQDYLVALRLGWLNYLMRDNAGAVRQYQQAARQRSGSIEPQLGSLLPLIAMARYSEAEKQAQQVLERDPQNHTANLRLAFVYRMQQKLPQAEQITKKLSTLYPSDRDFLIELALGLTAANKERDANLIYQQVLLVAPEDEIARRALGNVRTTSKQDAINAAFRKAAQLQREAKFAEAAAALAAVDVANSQEYIHQARLGYLQYLAGDQASSWKHYEAAVLAAPRAIEPLLGLLLPQLAQQDFAAAEETARRALKISPANYLANMRLAYALRMQEKFAEAETVNRKMLEMYPTDVTLLLEQALTLTGLERRDEAPELFRQVEVLTPASAAETSLENISSVR
jgi:tetratricopeptide (TPR) repeat protein